MSDNNYYKYMKYKSKYLNALKNRKMIGGVLGDNNIYDQECPICGDESKTHLYPLKCKHAFCKECAQEVADSSTTNIIYELDGSTTYYQSETKNQMKCPICRNEDTNKDEYIQSLSGPGVKVIRDSEVDDDDEFDLDKIKKIREEELKKLINQTKESNRQKEEQIKKMADSIKNTDQLNPNIDVIEIFPELPMQTTLSKIPGFLSILSGVFYIIEEESDNGKKFAEYNTVGFITLSYIYEGETITEDAFVKNISFIGSNTTILNLKLEFIEEFNRFIIPNNEMTKVTIEKENKKVNDYITRSIHHTHTKIDGLSIRSARIFYDSNKNMNYQPLSGGYIWLKDGEKRSILGFGIYEYLDWSNNIPKSYYMITNKAIIREYGVSDHERTEEDPKLIEIDAIELHKKTDWKDLSKFDSEFQSYYYDTHVRDFR